MGGKKDQHELIPVFLQVVRSTNIVHLRNSETGKFDPLPLNLSTLHLPERNQIRHRTCPMCSLLAQWGEGYFMVHTVVTLHRDRYTSFSTQKDSRTCKCTPRV